MTEVVVRIQLGNDAFSPDPVPEVARVLATVPHKLRSILLRKPGCVCTQPESDDLLRDVNGNTCGSLTIVNTKRLLAL